MVRRGLGRGSGRAVAEGLAPLPGGGGRSAVGGRGREARKVCHKRGTGTVVAIDSLDA